MMVYFLGFKLQGLEPGTEAQNSSLVCLLVLQQHVFVDGSRALVLVSPRYLRAVNMLFPEDLKMGSDIRTGHCVVSSAFAPNIWVGLRNGPKLRSVRAPLYP